MLSYSTIQSNKATILILIPTLSFIILTTNTQSAPIGVYHDCPNTTTYTPNSTYQTNLNLLLSSLSSNSTQNSTVFSTSTAGQTPPNVAYGLFLCRGDVTAEVCLDCMATATREVTTRCPNQKSAIIWYAECFLRYDNVSFFSTVDLEPLIYLVNGVNVTQQTRFQQVVGETMNELAKRASVYSPNDQFVNGFATQETDFTSSQRIYGLVQCTQDLSEDDCNRCLTFAINYLPQCCTGQQGARVLLPSCNVRYESYLFYREVATVPPPPVSLLVPSSPPPSSLTWPRARVRKSKKKYDAATDETDTNGITDVQSLQFDLRTIQAATNNFSYENKIGEGGFGMVYKGTLANGQEIAVKRLSKGSGQGTKEFKNEVVVVAKLQHRNLVTLLGFCLDGDEKILVYEYVLNKSLDYFLFDPEKQRQLDWSIRYNVIGGIARGMLYLHEDSRLRIIHRDLKASNILLDAKMNAKVSDFGIARIFGVDQTQGSTSRIVGTFGYMCPEYAMHGLYSMRSDVFSFGVLVLEIISGKKNSSFYQSDRGEHLLSHAWKLWKDGTPLEFVDPTLAATYSRNEVVRCIHIGLLCVQEDAGMRPSMATIVQVLSNYTVSLPLPEQPPFFFQSTTESCTRKLEECTSQPGMVSVDEASITQVHPK
ncbi:hypothetical protein LguiB_026905 [Lonicera macranthoides]